MPPEKVAVLIITGLIAILMSVTILKSEERSEDEARLDDGTNPTMESMWEIETSIDYEQLRQGRARTSSRKSKEKAQPAAHLAQAKPASPMRYAMKSGDTLGEVARRFCGRSSAYRDILKANPQIKDERKIQRGEVIVIPARLLVGAKVSAKKSAAPLNRGGGTRTYAVRSGDSLRKIARKLYGTESKWKLIYEANGDLIRDPATVRSGITLRIP